MCRHVDVLTLISAFTAAFAAMCTLTQMHIQNPDREQFLSETLRSINSTSNKLTAFKQMHLDYYLTFGLYTKKQKTALTQFHVSTHILYFVTYLSCCRHIIPRYLPSDDSEDAILLCSKHRFNLMLL